MICWNLALPEFIAGVVLNNAVNVMMDILQQTDPGPRLPRAVLGFKKR
jgi:hypothetical protein